MHDVISCCRSCGAPGLETFLSLGELPLANGLLDAEGLRQPELRYPLDVAFCQECSLVQILATVSPEVLFGKDFPYYSSFSETLLLYSKKNVERLIEARGLGPKSLVVEVGSNDGYLLQFLLKEGIPVLGIDPAPGPARAATGLGVPTICDFFDKGLARRLKDEGVRADVVIANNVLAHVPSLGDFVEGIRTILNKGGLAVIEVQYVGDLVDNCAFDTIYHEHHCYFSVTALKELFSRHGLSLSAVEHHPIHGGSLRLFVGLEKEEEPSVSEFLREEVRRGMTSVAYYRDFAALVTGLRDSLVTLLRNLKEEGRSLAGYGAAAKATTLLNYLGIGSNMLEFIVDRNVHKQGRFMPGVHIPISAPARLLEEMPDYVLLLAWNFKDEILRQQANYRAKGGKFIVSIPHPEVV
jgi:SAM-dependent methyltransferase